MTKFTIFVACPYMLFPLDDYKAVFSSLAKSYDIKFQFADEQITNQHVLGKILKYIEQADISLFDITGWNPNVALELGIAVGLNRRYFILLNSNHDNNKDVPSDIKGIDRVQYKSNSELEAKLIILLTQELPQKSDNSDSIFEKMKSQISNFISENQGLTLSKLAEGIGEDKLLVQSVIRAMISSDELKTKGAKKGTTYYTPEADLRKFRNK
jgi:nucleoside 2-deoxyribosyltransferase